MKKTPQEIVDGLEGEDLKHVAHLAMEKLQKKPGGVHTNDDSGGNGPKGNPPPPPPPGPGDGGSGGDA